MAKPTKKFWKIDCMMCETTMEMEAIVIQNMEETADFIIEPKYICGKCRSACVLELVEKVIEPPRVPIEQGPAKTAEKPVDAAGQGQKG